MKLKFYNNTIEFDKELDNLDKFVIDFTSILNKEKINYVIMSGYISILFGRNRTSEDVDMFIEKIDFIRFQRLWNLFQEKFECISTTDAKDAYETYLASNYAIRFSYKNKFIPNMEIKFPKVDLDKWSIENKKKVIINDQILFISPIELQISYKVFMSSEEGDKDIEDAKFIYEIFKGHIDMVLLEEFNRKLNIEERFNKYIK